MDDIDNKLQEKYSSLFEKFKGDFSFIQKMDTSERKNIALATYAVSQIPETLRYFDDSIKANLAIIKIALKKDGFSIIYSDKKFLNDRSLAKIAVEQNGLSIRYFSEEIRADAEIALIALKQNYQAAEYVSKKLFENKDFMIKAVKLNKKLLSFASTSLLENADFISNVLTLKKSKKFIMKLVRSNSINNKSAEIILKTLTNLNDYQNLYSKINRNWKEIKNVSHEHPNYKVFCRAALKRNGNAIGLMTSDIKQDFDLISIALKQNWKSIKHVNSEVLEKNPRQTAEILFSENWLALNSIFFPYSLKENMDVLLILAKYSAEAFDYVSLSILNEKSKALQLLNVNGLILQYLNKTLKSDQDIIRSAVNNNLASIKFSDNKLQDDGNFISSLITIKNKDLLIHLNDSMKKNKQIVIKFLQIDPSLITKASPSLYLNKAYINKITQIDKLEKDKSIDFKLSILRHLYQHSQKTQEIVMYMLNTYIQNNNISDSTLIDLVSLIDSKLLDNKLFAIQLISHRQQLFCKLSDSLKKDTQILTIYGKKYEDTSFNNFFDKLSSDISSKLPEKNKDIKKIFYDDLLGQTTNQLLVNPDNGKLYCEPVTVDNGATYELEFYKRKNNKSFLEQSSNKLNQSKLIKKLVSELLKKYPSIRESVDYYYFPLTLQHQTVQSIVDDDFNLSLDLINSDIRLLIHPITSLDKKYHINNKTTAYLFEWIVHYGRGELLSHYMRVLETYFEDDLHQRFRQFPFIKDGGLSMFNALLSKLEYRDKGMYLFLKYLGVSTNHIQCMLYKACYEGNKKLLYIACDKKASVTEKNAHGQTALHIIVLSGKIDLVSEIDNHFHYDINIKNESGLSPFFFALKLKQFKIAKQLAECDASLTTEDSYQNTPITWAIKNNLKKEIKFLYDLGVSKKAVDKNGNSVHHLAVLQNNTELLKYLLKVNDETDLVNKDGYTSLQLACKLGRSSLIYLLITNYGLQPAVKNSVDKNGNEQKVISYQVYVDQQKSLSLLLSTIFKPVEKSLIKLKIEKAELNKQLNGKLNKYPFFDTTKTTDASDYSDDTSDSDDSEYVLK